jgi:nucleoside 2-deoxyribosyltransferase
MKELSNMVFMGCNYNDKKIKKQFDNLKKRLESTLPLSCVIIDKRKSKAAKDIWKEIKNHIEKSAACVFDVTGFRPNVVLELGYALSLKSEEQIFITFRKRKSKGQDPKYLLSDIGHLNYQPYINIKELEKHIKEQLKNIPYSKEYYAFVRDCNNTNAKDKYEQCGFNILQAIRDNGSRSNQQIRQIMRGTSCHYSKMISLLRKHSLIKAGKGRNGKITIPEN